MKLNNIVIKNNKFLATNYNYLVANLDLNLLNEAINNHINYCKPIHSFINGKEIIPNEYMNHKTSPMNINRKIYKYSKYKPNNNEIHKNLMIAKKQWQRVSFDDKINIMQNICKLIETKYKYQLIAANIVDLGQDIKTAYYDSIANTIDYINYSTQNVINIVNNQNKFNENELNFTQYNPLQNSISVISSYNSASFAYHNVLSPLYFGNVINWNPSMNSLLSNRLMLDIFLEAGLPENIINFNIMDTISFTNNIMNHNVGGIIYNGLTEDYTMIKNKYYNFYNSKYQDYISETKVYNIKDKHIPEPLLITECQGNNFHFIEESADLDNAVNDIYDDAFNFSGQNRLSSSRLYIPKNLLDSFIKKMKQVIKDKKNYNQFNILKNQNILNNGYGLIDEKTFNKAKLIIDNIHFKNHNSRYCSYYKGIEFLCGGSYNNSRTYNIEPTIINVNNKANILLRTKLNMPLLTVYAYDNLEDGIDNCVFSSNYKSFGSIHSNDRDAIESLNKSLEDCSTNLFINSSFTYPTVGFQFTSSNGISGSNHSFASNEFMNNLYIKRNVKYNLNHL